MKKIDISPKAKKNMIIAGSAVICVGIAVTAMMLTAGTPAKNVESVTSDSSSTVSAVLSIAPIEGDSATESQASTFNPESGENQTKELTKIEKPTSTPPAPVVEGDSSVTSDGKETQPTNPALTDKNRKPSYASKPTAPSNKTNTDKSPSSKPSINTPSKPTDNKPTNNKPKNGEVRNGKMYDPDFGWIPIDGPNEETQASDMYEDGVKVGIMD